MRPRRWSIERYPFHHGDYRMIENRSLSTIPTHAALIVLNMQKLFVKSLTEQEK